MRNPINRRILVELTDFPSRSNHGLLYTAYDCLVVICYACPAHIQHKIPLMRPVHKLISYAMSLAVKIKYLFIFSKLVLRISVGATLINCLALT
jgi:hypothetical protein